MITTCILIAIIMTFAVVLSATICELRDLKKVLDYHSEIFGDLTKLHTAQSKSYLIMVKKVADQERSLNELYSSYFREHGEDVEVIH